MGDYHVRFCERLGVKFPLPTRHLPLDLMQKNQMEGRKVEMNYRMKSS